MVRWDVERAPTGYGEKLMHLGQRLGRAWGIGQKGKDDGVILLVAVGTGISNLVTARTPRETISPFKA